MKALNGTGGGRGLDFCRLSVLSTEHVFRSITSTINISHIVLLIRSGGHVIKTRIFVITIFFVTDCFNVNRYEYPVSKSFYKHLHNLPSHLQTIFAVPSFIAGWDKCYLLLTVGTLKMNTFSFPAVGR